MSRHERAIRRIYAGRTAYAGTKPCFDQKLLLLAFTNRSGSTLLAELLTATGRVAGGGEFLNAETVARQSAQAPEAFPAYIAHLVQRQCHADAVYFCLKANVDQLAMLIRWNIPAMFQGFEIIHCWRDDLIAQAVSYSIAAQTLTWTAAQVPAAQMTAAHAPTYNHRQIARRIADQAAENAAIRAIVDALGRPRHVVSYEQLCRNPELHLKRLLAALGAPAPQWTYCPPQLVRQAKQINRDFVARFRRETLSRLHRRTWHPLLSFAKDRGGRARASQDQTET